MLLNMFAAASIAGMVIPVMYLCLSCIGIFLAGSIKREWRICRKSLPLIIVAIGAAAALMSIGCASNSPENRETPATQKLAPAPAPHKAPPEIVKNDCQRLVQGQLLFEPSRTMRQGKPYLVFARLTRAPGLQITEGLDRSHFVIEDAEVSCKVSMSLDAEEPGAFRIENVPADRKDEQFLEPDRYTEWDWRVTPKHHGSVHLLLYVAPMLYVDGIGEQLKQFPQPPKVITVGADYLYQYKTLVAENWATIGGLLTAIVIPLFLWFRKGLIDWFKQRSTKKGSVGFHPG